MTTYHVYKTDCFGASRVLLQASWDDHSVFIHLPSGQRATMSLKNIESRKLNLWQLLACCVSRNRAQGQTFVFHAQPSLPYLIVARIVLFCLRDRKTVLVYDMHDLHEKTHYLSIWHRIRYGFIRHLTLSLLESLAFRSQRIRMMTVSEGLAQTVAEKYLSSLPAVVRSAPKPSYTASELEAIPRKENALLFFGTPERVPVELIEDIGTAGLELHLFGRGITEDFLTERLGTALPTYVKIFGEYSPFDLDFIARYNYVLLYKPEVKSLNFRFSLPNKLFQGMNYGTTFIVSQNFEEIIRTLSNTPDAVVVLPDLATSGDMIPLFGMQRDKAYWGRITALSLRLHEEAKYAYMMVTRRK